MAEGTRITVDLLPDVHRSLEGYCARTGQNKTFVSNRALSLLLSVMEEVDAGAEVMIRRPGGETLLIKFF